MKNYVITIGRQCGSGGHSIGKALSERLDIPFYDKEIIELAEKESGFDKKIIEEKGEHMEGGMLGNLAHYLSYGGKGKYEDYQPLQDRIYFVQSKIIKELAEKGSCVIVGRCADHILEKQENVLNIFIHADMKFKKERCMERGQFSAAEAERLIQKRDKLRADHYKYYTEMEWGHSSNYHLCLDSGMLGIERCVRLIEDVYRELSGNENNG